MGRPKLLLPLRGKSLVRLVVDEAVGSRARQVVVVTGANREEVERELGGLPIKLVHNPEHREGMSTSVRAGLRVVRPEADAAIILLADQPLVDRAVLDGLFEVYERSRALIVQPSYDGQLGNPILWDRRLFGELMAQVGDKGGRDLLRTHAAEVVRWDIPDAAILQDVDTPEAYEALRSSVEGTTADVPGSLADASPPHDHVGHGPRFCPSCGGTLREEIVQDRARPVCAVCRSVFWIDPKVAVAVVIPWEGGVLLGRRAIEPGRGLWSFPSGYVDRGEVPEDAARREVREETGLDVEISGLVGVYATAGRPVILVVYVAEARSERLEPGPEVLELAAFSPDDFPTMAFDHDRRIVHDWAALRRRQARPS